ncbi:MAG: hypothetical protein QOE70_6117 [Chthoniobacter sp.]|nr:hypothetical protein [Chthoniobacter sp.]
MEMDQVRDSEAQRLFLASRKEVAVADDIKSECIMICSKGHGTDGIQDAFRANHSPYEQEAEWLTR